jgi:hypothetical protein
MTTNSTSTQANEGQVPPVLAYGLRLTLYGLLATAGTVAVVDGLRKLFEYWRPGINEPGSYLVGVAIVLTLGFTLLLAAIAGTVTLAIERGA